MFVIPMPKIEFGDIAYPRENAAHYYIMNQ